jgi:dTDP-4-dehydrorhamnose reductase
MTNLNNKKKILISGGEGKFANQLIMANEEYDILSPGHTEMNITSIKSIDDFISNTSPDIFLHSAAFTRPMSKHQDFADVSIETNIIGTANVVLSCMKYKVKLVYISTDYVYPGTEGNYKEDSPISPYYGKNDGITKYGWSKLGGEASVRMYDNSLILRVCMCNYPFPHSAALEDIKKSLIFDYDAAKIVLKLLNEKGIINIGGKSQTVYDFTVENNIKIDKIKKSDIKDVDIAPDTSMNTDKMNMILEKLK